MFFFLLLLFINFIFSTLLLNNMLMCMTCRFDLKTDIYIDKNYIAIAFDKHFGLRVSYFHMYSC